MLAKAQEIAWTPFQPATIGGQHVVAVADKHFSVFKNSRYTVLVRRVELGGVWPNMIHLSIKRNDKESTHDWRDLQRIKNEIVGQENEAVELYPAESRLLDTANQFHLWALADPAVRFPFGYQVRVVTERGVPGSKQRPLGSDEKPDDLDPHGE